MREGVFIEGNVIWVFHGLWRRSRDAQVEALRVQEREPVWDDPPLCETETGAGRAPYR